MGTEDTLSEKQKEAVEQLHSAIKSGENTCQALRNCLLVFENYPLETAKNLPFTYTFKLNRYGEKGNEILINRKQKPLARSSVRKAFDKVVRLSNGSFPVKFSSPKELEIYGASYVYVMFIRFGLIEHNTNNKRKR